MTKFYSNAQKKPKAKPSKPSSNMEATSHASTSTASGLWDSLRQCDQVVFNLNNGASVEALIDDLEEDEDVIFGVTPEGRNFAIPRASVAFVMEGV